MNLFHVKICGVTKPSDAVSTVLAGADAIGLNFYQGSKRYVRPELAIQISEAIRAANPDTKVIGVFVNSSATEIFDVAKQCRLDGVQLHGDESLEIIEQLRSKLEHEDLLILRAVRTNPQAERIIEVNRVQAEIDGWTQAGSDGILLDAAAPGEFGGTGKNVDWSVVPSLKCTVFLILAGGLTPENVAEAIQSAQVSAVDVASGVESAVGVKDHQKVKTFCENAMKALI